MSEQLPLKITTWNVLNHAYEKPEYYHKDSHPYLHWNKGRKEAVLNYITKLDSDVFCLQEVNKNMASLITEALNTKYEKSVYLFIWKRRNNEGTEDGSATIFRKDLLIEIKSFVHYYANRTHMLLCAQFCFIGTKKDILIVNTHVDWKTRERDLSFLLNDVKNHPDYPNCPIVVMGDFNAEASEDWYKQLESFSVVDAYKAYHGELAQFSYNSGKNKKFIDFMLLWFLGKESIDTIFLGVDQKNPLDLNQITTMPAKDLPSDHLPVTLHLKWTYPLK